MNDPNNLNNFVDNNTIQVNTKLSGNTNDNQTPYYNDDINSNDEINDELLNINVGNPEKHNTDSGITKTVNHTTGGVGGVGGRGGVGGVGGHGSHGGIINSIGTSNVENKVKTFEDNFKKTDFNDYSFFRMGQTLRYYWPHDLTKTEQKLPALTLADYGLKNNDIIFEINQKNWMDPYSAYFSFYIQNNCDFDIQLDNSIHSMINSLTIYINGVEVENMIDYPLLTKLYFDMTLDQNEREKRRENEGFGLNEGGTGEKILESRSKSIFTKDQKEVKNEEYEMKNTGKSFIQKDKNLGVLFKVPFMSKFFGQKIENKNWRLLPLRNMKLTIKLSTNMYAFFKPLNKDEDVYRKDKNLIIKNSKTLDRIKILEPKFNFTEYTFSEGFDRDLTNAFEQTELVYDFLDYEIFQKNSILNETVELQLPFKQRRKRSGIRAFLFMVQDNTHLHSSYARPLARLNM
tara:strand:- start:3331 stop:4707 length:1377 start_codon:yes stop_codon:yes gene_type:complete